MVDRFEKFSFAVSEITRYLHKITTDEMEKYGLKGPYSVYFTTMYRFPEGITSAKLAEHCIKDKADVSRAVSVLEDKGLVKRIGTNNNLYRANIVLTDEGRKLAEQINEKAKSAVEFAGKDLTEENRKIFYESLELIITNLQILSKEGI